MSDGYSRLVELLGTPEGLAAEHAIIGVLVAACAFLAAWLERRTRLLESTVDARLVELLTRSRELESRLSVIDRLAARPDLPGVSNKVSS